MSSYNVAFELSVTPASASGSEAARAAMPYRLAVYIACTVFAVALNYLLGKEMAWDSLNYHFYAGFSAIHDRFSQDYFAAGPQSYIEPYAYAPFYLLVRSGLPALMIGSILAIVHSSVLWLTFELALLVSPDADHRMRLLFGLCAVAMAAINPILLQQIGSSFADITTAIPVLCGWVLLASAVRGPGMLRIVGAGLLLGAASALKLTNALPAFAGFIVLLMLPVGIRQRLSRNFQFACSLGLGFAVASAPWSYRLWNKFHNPLFPLFNNVFRSPEFTTAPLLHYRFIPDSLSEALWRPFAMANPYNMIHEELRAPDIRYCVLLVASFALLANWLWTRSRSKNKSAIESDADSVLATHALAALGCALAVDWAVWLKESGNSRYFLPMSCIAAVVIVGVLFRLFRGHSKIRNYVLAAIFAVQGVQLCMGTEFRWNSVPWGGRWFQVTVPEKLASEPNLYLTMGIQSNSYIVPFLASGSGFVNFSGGYALGPTGPNGARVKALIERHAPNLRFLLSGDRLYGDHDLREPHLSQIDDALGRFGLNADTSDCSSIVIHGLPPPLEVTLLTSVRVKQRPRRDVSYLLSCHLVPRTASRAALIAGQRTADIVLDRLEDVCPSLFQPRRPLTEYSDGIGIRVYLNTDLKAWVSHGAVRFQQTIRGDDAIYVGRESDWVKAPQKLVCGRRNGNYFARLPGARTP
ncbi:MAG: hypothetical protein ACREUT_19270 [Steroidobacteraceae bacterium]